MFQRIVRVFSLFLLLFFPLTAAGEIPFAPGETLRFQLKWEVIPAGEATLQVLPLSETDGIPSFHFVMTAESNSFVDVFYKVRDRVESFTDTEVTRSLHYQNKQREGGTKRDIVVRFDWDKGEAQYSNGDKKTPPVSIRPGAFDPLGIFYYLRTLSFDETTAIERPVTDGKKCVSGRGNIIRRETITVPAGTFETFLIEPELKDIGGVFKKSKDAKIQLWVTTDERHLPVKIESKVVIGSFTGELVEALP